MDFIEFRNRLPDSEWTSRQTVNLTSLSQTETIMFSVARQVYSGKYWPNKKPTVLCVISRMQSVTSIYLCITLQWLSSCSDLKRD